MWYVEGQNYRYVDSVFPLIAAFMDRTCGKREKQFDECCQYILHSDYGLYPGKTPNLPWTDREVTELENVTQNFHGLVASCFDNYELSGFYTKKFHGRCHL